MNRFEQEGADQSQAITNETRDLIHDFKIAAGALVAISLTIQLLLHLFVPGM